MLFSSSAAPGQAKVVPCANDILKPQNLIDEAERLWRAEDGKSGQISSSWQRGNDGGCVVLCVNSDRRSNDHDRVVDAWKKRVAEEQAVYSRFPKSPDDDRNLVSEDGILSFWPEGELEFDFLLATANYPFRLDQAAPYPNPLTIAEAWLKNLDQLYYFNGNCLNGIRTFQDAQIELLLSAKLDPLSR